MADALGFAPDPEIRCRDFAIGCIGAGFIMADVHLASYKKAGFPVVALASRTPAKAAEVAKRWDIPTVHETPRQLIEDPQVQITGPAAAGVASSILAATGTPSGCEAGGADFGGGVFGR